MTYYVKKVGCYNTEKEAKVDLKKVQELIPDAYIYSKELVCGKIYGVMLGKFYDYNEAEKLRHRFIKRISCVMYSEGNAYE